MFCAQSSGIESAFQCALQDDSAISDYLTKINLLLAEIKELSDADAALVKLIEQDIKYAIANPAKHVTKLQLQAQTLSHEKSYKLISSGIFFIAVGMDVSLLGSFLLTSPLSLFSQCLITTGVDLGVLGMEFLLGNKRRHLGCELNELVNYLEMNMQNQQKYSYS